MATSRSILVGVLPNANLADSGADICQSDQFNRVSANRINSIVAPEHLKEDAVNRFEIAMVSVGALLLVLTIIGMASPN